MKPESHITPNLNRDLESVQIMIARMGGLVEAAIMDAARSLETHDDELANAVLKGDRSIDALEEQINAETARLIALHAPAAADLRTALTAIKIAAALERCGDYAKNLAKRSTVLSKMPAVGNSAGLIRRMARAVQQQLKNVLDAYVKGDADLAERVRQTDHDIDQMYNSLFREFLAHMMEDPRNISTCLHLHFIAKNIERMGDHASGIAEQVIYLTTGTLPVDDRPKADNTSITSVSADREIAWRPLNAP
ncbi:MAG: phosphate signaling complex protein PhoU [Rhodobacteraceae bacterium]|nr:phosphate signaling complex protein PhoU [Paracoccaceae bacterium]